MPTGHQLDATPRPSVAVLGAGSWGTALAALIARHGHSTVLWGRDAATISAIEATGENPRYLPGIPLPGNLRATTALPEAMADADLVLVVVPSHAFAETLRALAPWREPGAGVAWATKGFEPGSGRFLHEVAGEVLGDDVPLAVVTGPSFAKEVAEGLPTALTVHSEDAVFCQQVADALHGPAFRAYTGDDMCGAELGGAMKNVLAVATGVADGMDLGLNARAGLITRGLNEMLRLNIGIGHRFGQGGGRAQAAGQGNARQVARVFAARLDRGDGGRIAAPQHGGVAVAGDQRGERGAPGARAQYRDRRFFG